MFRATPSRREISLIGTPSARCRRRISDQSSTDNTPSASPRRGQSQSDVRGSVSGRRRHLSYSRDPFVCFTTSQDLGTFFDCHRRAFAHFGGVPAAIVYDRTKTVVRRHVAPGRAVPLHPQAAAFAEHYGFAIDVLAAYRPTGKGRVERQVAIVREHVLAGRSFLSTAAEN
ncbi:DDE-type integrase/transposase/recombinase [Pseudonocardia sp. EV170527-09]|uniref:DDE-type integrase/transposase/recombinase n=1 Tax=Pseudonocardia sp. EV170527-09 TaxID=2603411 RepID=UPI00351A16FB